MSAAAATAAGHWTTLQHNDLPGTGPRVRMTRAVCQAQGCGWHSAWMIKPRATEAGLTHSGTPDTTDTDS